MTKEGHTANRVDGLANRVVDDVRLSHHRPYGSRIRRFNGL